MMSYKLALTLPPRCFNHHGFLNGTLTGSIHFIILITDATGDGKISDLLKTGSCRDVISPDVISLPGESPWTEEPGGLQTMGSQRVRHY